MGNRGKKKNQCNQKTGFWKRETKTIVTTTVNNNKIRIYRLPILEVKRNNYYRLYKHSKNNTGIL